MASRIERRLLRVPRGWRSAEVASFHAQLDDVYRRLFDDLAGITPAELRWQPKRGTNTIGMLLAHLAIVEVFWTQIAQQARRPDVTRRVLGIGDMDDGMPIAHDASPPAALAKHGLPWFRGLIQRGHRFGTTVAKEWTTRSLSAVVERRRPDGSGYDTDRRWILYHLVEHQAGHHGQILLLRHLYRDRRRR